MRRIGVLSGGGDAPGINAVIRAVTLDAVSAGIEVVGVFDGFLGLIEGRTRALVAGDVEDLVTVGGSILGCSNKANPLRFCTGKDDRGVPIFEDVTPRCLEHVDALGLDALVCIGGDGTLTCAQPLADPRAFGHDHPGVNCVGVPKTIDNDIVGTDLTFGFLSAVGVASEAMDRVRTTAASHHRVITVEVMGRNAGWIALWSGLASGVHAILVPEMPFEIEALAASLRARRNAGQRYSVVAVAEGARPRGGSSIVARVDPTSPDPIKLGGVAKFVADELERTSGIESRYVVLGHVQRGGSPTAADRVLATRFGHHAMRVLREGKRNRMVAYLSSRMTDIDLKEPAGKQRLIASGEPLVEAARDIGISFGISFGDA